MHGFLSSLKADLRAVVALTGSVCVCVCVCVRDPLAVWLIVVPLAAKPESVSGKGALYEHRLEHGN